MVNDGAEAMQYMIGEQKYADREQFAYPTFITLDLKMPRVDGFGVLEFLKKNPHWRIIPTVMLSGSSDPDDIKKAYMLGASSYHLKPSNQEDLCKLIKALHTYWELCEVPLVDSSGKQLPTDGVGKIGERFDKPESNADAPHR